MIGFFVLTLARGFTSTPFQGVAKYKMDEGPPITEAHQYVATHGSTPWRVAVTGVILGYISTDCTTAW